MNTRTKINNKETTIEIIGKLVFDPIDMTKKHASQSEWKKVAYLKVEGDLGAYYRWYMKENHGLILQQTIRGDHITFISDRYGKGNIERYEAIKQKYNGKKLKLSIDVSKVYSNGTHWWFDIYDCDFFKNIRVSCGFPERPFFGFHMTIGYANDIHMPQSEYVYETFKLFDL